MPEKYRYLVSYNFRKSLTETGFGNVFTTVTGGLSEKNVNLITEDIKAITGSKIVVILNIIKLERVK